MRKDRVPHSIGTAPIELDTDRGVANPHLIAPTYDWPAYCSTIADIEIDPGEN